MNLFYISPSTLPSKAANSVHVVRQCEGLIRLGVDVTIFSKRSVPDEKDFQKSLHDSYGVDLTKAKLISYWSPSSRADNLKIALLSLSKLCQTPRPDIILSRNLYAAYLIGLILRIPLIYETHHLENGFRKYVQGRVIDCPWITTVVVSKKLLECVVEHFGFAPKRTLVLHDAACEGIEPLDKGLRRSELFRIFPEISGEWDCICGYFGHLYKGRGIEIIEEMAKARPHVLFLVIGGNETELNAFRLNNSCKNLMFMGHVPHHVALETMRCVDTLLMPYQKSVSLGVGVYDTARWMSPMKMFEYMASGVPIISSDLPVLREVLKDGVNALLVPPDEAGKWIDALDRLMKDEELSRTTGIQAHMDYKRNYTWTQRAKKLLNFQKLFIK